MVFRYTYHVRDVVVGRNKRRGVLARSVMIKILLVEDNDIDARLTKDILAEWGTEEFDILRVTCLSDAFARLARARFDAVLLDLSLPDGYGLSTVRQMQAANPTIAIIVLSGLNDQTLALQVVQMARRITSSRDRGSRSYWPAPSGMPLNENGLKSG